MKRLALLTLPIFALIVVAMNLKSPSSIASKYGLSTGSPDIQAMHRLTFGPDGIFASDPDICIDPRTNFQKKIAESTQETIIVVSTSFITKNVPIHFSKSCPSEILLICALLNPNSERNANNPTKANPKPIIPKSSAPMYRRIKNKAT